jgi:hypothetical protein
MKKLVAFAAAATLLSGSLYAQDSKLYLVLEFMKVKEGKTAAYLETEDFWAGIHKQRALAGETLGWDLWALEPSGTDQGYQYLTVNLFGSMEAMLKQGEAGALLAHAKKAYPKMTEREVAAKFNATSDTRELAVRLFLERVDNTKGGPEMKEGTIALIASMMASDGSYEKMESEIFKPWHQKMVDAGAKSSWIMARVMFPAGSDRYASHLIVNMYKDLAQYVAANDYQGPQSTLATDLAVQAGLKTRDMKSVRFATLIKMVRK